MSNLEQQELEKCKLALKLYAIAKKEYSEENTNLDSFDKRMIEMNASLLVNDSGDGLRVGGPMSSNMKFRYGKVHGLPSSNEKMFHLDSNDVSDSDPDFQRFQKVVADKFKENNLPFYSFEA